MSDLSSLGEARIDEAIASGELTPPPAGTDIDLENYFATPSAWRAGFSMLKGHGFTPPELELLKRAATLEAALDDAPDAAECLRLRRELEECRVRYRMAMEQRRGG